MGLEVPSPIQGVQVTSLGSRSSLVLPLGAQLLLPALQDRGPQCGAPWGAPLSPGAPIPGDTGDPHPTSRLLSGTPHPEQQHPQPNPEVGGPGREWIWGDGEGLHGDRAR